MKTVESPFFKHGYLEVFCGPMKSGKTRELLNRVDKFKYIDDVNFIFIKPRVDTRDEKIISRFGELEYECIFIEEGQTESIVEIVQNHNLVIIDEVQFFDNKIIEVIKKLTLRGYFVIVSGLDLDFRGEVFGSMGEILCLADKVNKLRGVCECEGCQSEATRTQRLINNEPAHYDSPIILVGDEDEGYYCRCTHHHEVKKSEKLTTIKY